MQFACRKERNANTVFSWGGFIHIRPGPCGFITCDSGASLLSQTHYCRYSVSKTTDLLSLLAMVWRVFVQETGEQTACSRQPQEFVFSCAYLFELIRGLRKEKREWKLPRLRSRSRKIRSNSTERVGIRPSSLCMLTTLIMLFQTTLPSVF